MAGNTEMLDVFDRYMNPAGTLPRSVAHGMSGEAPPESWHAAASFFLLRKGVTGDVEVLLQLRDRGKAVYPGKFCASASGHVSAGETPEDAAREIKEEIGVDIPGSAMVPFGIRISEDRCPRGRWVDREFVHRFFKVLSDPVPFVLEPGSVTALVSLPLSSVPGLADGGLSPVGLLAGEIDGPAARVSAPDLAHGTLTDLMDLTVAFRAWKFRLAVGGRG